jgi:hypothetical protein
MPTHDDSEAERVLKMMIKPYVEAAYARGRADERADVVAWLLTDAPGVADTRAHQAALIRTGHVDAAKKDKP